MEYLFIMQQQMKTEISPDLADSNIYADGNHTVTAEVPAQGYE